MGVSAGDRAQNLDMVLHCCGPEIVYDRIVSALEDPSVYPRDTSLSWNFNEGNPSLEDVLRTTSLRVWGTYPRALLSNAEGAEASVALESFLLKHRAWLEAEGYLHRVVIGPDCCPGAFSGEEVPTRGCSESRVHNDKRPALSVMPVAADEGSWSNFQLSDK